MDDGGRGADAGPLSAVELRALADVFTDPVSARHVLEVAGVAAGRQPPWQGGPAEQFWREVNTMLRAGVVADGRARLLAAARSSFPANTVFAAGLPAADDDESSPGAGRVRPPWNVLPALPPRFVPRDDAMGALRRLLADPGRGPVVGLLGMGGAGKSTLARALVHDPGVRAAFPDGVVWVEVNPDPDITAVVSAVLAAFGDAAPVFDVAEGSERLRRLLAGATCLVVADNVWQVDVLRALPVAGRTRLLVTTRSRDALFTDSTVYEVGRVDVATARRVLAAYAGCPVEALPAGAEAVSSRCGGLVLALALAGGMAGEGRPWANVAERLRRADLGWLAGRFADYPHPNLLAALDASVTALPAETARRFRELAVFDGRGPVPAQVVTRLWQASAGMDGLDADEVLRMFGRRSLVQIDPRADTVTVHDLLFDYARSTLASGRLPELHRLLAEDFLGRWGGLGHHLPGLRDVAELADADRYGVGALVGHLLAARRLELVDEMLAAEWPNGAGGVDNAWYTVHENLGQTGDYLADIRAVWQDAEAATDQAAAAGQDPASIGREIGCALVMGSIASIAANIPPALLLRLVEEGIWPPSRALAYAQVTPEPAARAQALAGLAPYLPAALLPRSVETAATIGHSYNRAQALGGLAPYLPAALLARALEAAAAIETPYDRAEALVGLAPYLPAALLARALDAAAAIDHPFARAQVLGVLAPHLPADDRDPVLMQAVHAAATISDPYARAQALGGLAPYLPAALLAQALDAAAAIDHLYARAQALGKLLPYLPADDRGPVLAEALDAAATIGEQAYQARALGGLVPHLPADARGPVLARALEAAAAVEAPYERAKALGGLVPHLPADARGPVLTRALEAAAAVEAPYDRAKALGGLVPHLPADARGPVLAQALEAAATIDAPYDKAEALGGLAPHLPAALLVRAVQAAATIGDPYAWAEALGGLAPHLPADDRGPVLARAVQAATTIGDPYSRAQLLGGLAPHLPAALLAQALGAATTVDTPYDRARALGGVAPHLAADARGPVLAQALEAAATIDAPYDKAEALGGLAPHLPAALLARAVQAAATIGDPYARAQALAELAPHLPAGDRGPVLDQAVQTAVTIDTPYDRAQVLGGLALHLGAEDRGPVLTRALEAAAAVDTAYDRAKALGALAPHLGAGDRGPVLAQALEAATGIDTPYDKAKALGGLVQHLPADSRSPVLARALDAAATVGNPYDRARALGGLVRHLSADARGPVLARALDAAAAVGNSYARADALGELAPHLWARLLDGAVQAATTIDHPDYRARALTAIASAASANRRTSDPGHWRAALRAAAYVNRNSVVAVLPVIFPYAPSTTASQAAWYLVRVQRWWP